jgi:hypothetical protein
MSAVPLGLVLLVILAVLTPAVTATTQKCDQTITINDYGAPGPHPDHSETIYWMGVISGDLSGTIYFWELMPDPYLVGNVMHFLEDFYIDFGDGWVSGYDKGVWNFATFKYRATGWVTDASANYEDLIGCKFHEEGVTNHGPESLPITGTGTCFIGP